MTVGFYSPLPPARTGVSDYSAALLAELRRRGRVEVGPAHCDVALYHLGNNALHAGIYRRALEKPGVVVLHDAVLHHFLLGQLEEAAYVEEFVYNYGEWQRGMAHELWRVRASSASDPRYFAISPSEADRREFARRNGAQSRRGVRLSRRMPRMRK